MTLVSRRDKTLLCVGVRIVGVLVLAIAVIYPVTAAAQSFGPDGRPTVPLMDEGRPAVGFVIAEGAPIYDAPDRSSPTLTSGEFLQKFNVADKVKDGTGREYLLLANVDPTTRAIVEFHGWIDERFLLTSHEAIKVPESAIYKKALIVNEWRKAEGGLLGLEAAPIFAGPGKRDDGSDYEKLTERGLFTFYYIYAEVGREGENYFLLGEQPVITSDQHPERALIGWISGERVHIWDTRDAIEYKKDNLTKRIAGLPEAEAGVKIFESMATLKAHCKGVPTSEPLAEEDITVVTPWPYHIQRYPLLEAKSAESADVPLAGRLLRIGYIGDQIYTETGEPGVTAQELDDARAVLGGMKKDLNNIDLLFVIDATGSMYRFFDPAADAVNSIISTVQRDYGSGPERPRVRFSVTFYRDYADADGQRGPGNPADTYLWKREPLTEDPQRILEFLRSERIPDGAGGDEPEAVFEGIIQAVEQAKKEMADASYRMVILVGDKGNHRTDQQGHTAAKVTKLLKEGFFDFTAIHVVPQAAVDGDRDVRLFQDQSMQIVRALPEGDGEYLIDADPRDVANRIIAGGSRAVESATTAQRATVEFRDSGKSIPDLQMKYGTRLTKRLVDLMKSKGVDPAIFSRTSVQIFERGWVAERSCRNGLLQVQQVVLVGRPDLETLIAIIAGFLRDQPTKQDVIRTWTSVLQLHLGEDIDLAKPLSEQIKNHLGLPVRNKMLDKSVYEISSLPPDELAKLFKQLRIDLTQMRAVISEREVDIEAGGESDGRSGSDIVVTEKGRRKYWFPAKGQDMAWIPYEMLP